MKISIIIAVIVLSFAYLVVAGILFAQIADARKHEADTLNFVLFVFVVCLLWPLTLPPVIIAALFSKDGENEK